MGRVGKLVDLAKASLSDLRRTLIPDVLPRAEQYRTFFGRSVDLNRIQAAMRQADDGLMVDITDLGREMVMLDPHLSSVCGKRFNSIGCLEWTLDPASGDNVDKELATQIADKVRRDIERIPHFSARLVDLAWGAFDARAALETKWAVYPQPEGWRPVDLKWIHPRRISYGAARELRLIDTWSRRGNFSSDDGVAFDDFPGKFVQYQPRLFGEYPEREGLNPRTLYWAFFKRFDWRMRMALTEIYGIPWRIVEADKDAPTNYEELRDAANEAEALGETTTMGLPPGAKLNITSPGEQDGNLFKMTSDDVNSEMSKLVLGNTGTTDAVANRAESIVHKSEQEIGLAFDAGGISTAMQRDLVEVDTALNFGDAALDHAPIFRLNAEPPRDRLKEIERVEKVVSMSVPVSLSELREVAGVRTPAEDEPVLVAESAGVDAMGKPLPDRIRVVEPGEAPRSSEPEPQLPGAAEPSEEPTEADSGPAEAGSVELSPTDIAIVVTVDEARASQGLGPWPDPDEGAMTVAEFKALKEAEGETVGIAEGEVAAKEIKPDPEPGAAPTPPPPNAPPVAPSGAAPPPGAAEASSGDEPIEEAGTDGQKDAAEDELFATARRPLTLPFAGYPDFDACVLDQTDKGHDEESARRICGALKEQVEAERRGGEESLEGLDRRRFHILAEAPSAPPEEPPGKVFGSVDTITEMGAEHGAEIVGALAKHFEDAVKAKDDEAQIRAALSEAYRTLDLEPFVDSIQETELRSVMLGALDSDWEAENDEVVKPAAFERPKRLLEGAMPSFVQRPFNEAVSAFLQREVLSADAFYALAGEARKKAFTISGILSSRMLDRAQLELAETIERGEDLRNFRKRLGEAFEGSGYTMANRSHVEVVYRNATMSAYASGREAQMTQPEVLAARPYWQIVTVADSRRRETHGAVHHKVLRADDPFWATGPPWGHNCRCRKVSRSAADVERLGLEVTDGSSITGLPDPGWAG